MVAVTGSPSAEGVAAWTGEGPESVRVGPAGIAADGEVWGRTGCVAGRIQAGRPQRLHLLGALLTRVPGLPARSAVESLSRRDPATLHTMEDEDDLLAQRAADLRLRIEAQRMWLAVLKRHRLDVARDAQVVARQVREFMALLPPQ